MMDKLKIELPDVIKVFAVVTAMPRWVGALLAAEGFPLPPAWMAWWIPASAIMSAGMAIVEGLAFAYVFAAWRKEQDRNDTLLWLALLSALLFVGVLAPYIAASVIHADLATVLSNGWALASWSIAVGASTIAIVASVGYAQKQPVKRSVSAHNADMVKVDAPAMRALSAHVCASCGTSFASQPALAAHMRWKHTERVNGKVH